MLNTEKSKKNSVEKGDYATKIMKEKKKTGPLFLAHSIYVLLFSAYDTWA